MRDDAPTASAERLDARITGRVQGVGFRHFTTTTAHDLGLGGWVRNEPDGSVRLVAEGPPDALDRLVEAVREGPAAARVDGVTTDRSDPTGDFDAFRVRR